MKIEINMGTEMLQGESSFPPTPHPFAKVKLDITKEELDSIRKEHKEIFLAIARILNFTVQFVQ